MSNELTYFRGDSWPKGFTIKDKATKLPIDITGCVFTMTVDTEKDPPDDTTKLFDVAGVLDADPLTGKVSFTPTEANTDQIPGTFYYDIQGVGGVLGTKRTVVKDKFIITQDITKT
jgi:hypothetical protein